MSDLNKLTLAEARDLLRSGETSSVALTEACLGAIEGAGALNAFVHNTPDLALERAGAADARLAAGNAPAMCGLPIGIKDLTPVKGVLTTMGNRALRRNYPLANAPMVDRLIARGALIMGKTNTPEMGAGGNTFNDVFGMTRNPWDTSRNAGGSSGGAAVSLAAGEV